MTALSYAKYSWVSDTAYKKFWKYSFYKLWYQNPAVNMILDQIESIFYDVIFNIIIQWRHWLESNDVIKGIII